MKRMCVLCLLPLCATAALSRQVVDYQIRARLDPAARAVTGSQVLKWLNDSPDLVRELRFHLYMNAFKNEKSTFMRESGGPSRGYRVREGEWGWIDIRRLRIAGGPDLTRAIRFIHPDDGNADDQTVIAVDLPQPVKPGETITLHIDFHTRLPHVLARTGYHGQFYMVAQWFPKIGVWEKAGDRYAAAGGWNCHQFHANSEFYADYGRYDVTITVPSRYEVGATGVMASWELNAASNTSTYRFVQEDVHDFAWTASPTFRRVERLFVAGSELSARDLAEAARLLGQPADDLQLGDVRMILLIQPEHASQVERHFKAVVNGLKYFGLWYGKYPYRTITVVDPPYGGRGAGGMEYPTLITAGTSWLASDREQSPEMVTVHEFGHQFWYGLVGNNEFEESWLDEGINTYSTSKILDKAYPPGALPMRAFGLPLSRWLEMPRLHWDVINRAAYLVSPKADSMVRNAWEYYDSTSYAINSYMRPGVVLRTLENHLGERTMARILRAFHQRWRFRHPTTHDFIKVVNEVSGRDMQWFFDQFVFGSNILDYRVAGVSSRELGVERGVFDGPQGRTTIDKRPEPRQKLYESEVRIQREGEAVFPVAVRIRFKDGHVAEREWDGRYRWTKYTFVRPAEVESVVIDPERKMLLDANFANNSYTARVQAAPLLKWTASLLFWVQNLLVAASG
ncbi:MAG: M1 family metallopeptidase, partial [Acidobacteriota bacterium]